MHTIEIEHLGPIEHCVLEDNQITILTGPQAAGKSTVAKAVFFFRTIKDDILTVLLKRAAGLTNEFEVVPPSINTEIEKVLRAKFLSIFGSSWAMDSKMRIKYSYNSTTNIEVSLKDSHYQGEANYVWIEYSANLRGMFREWQQARWGRELSEIKASLSEQLSTIFCDRCETVFVPAGRSMITLLTVQLNYIFTTMDENMRRTIDYCTQTYIERILKLKPQFAGGVQGLLSNKLSLTQEAINKPIVKEAINLVDAVLKGRYAYIDGEERLSLNNGKFVKINFASSGQQEAVWILNLIFYYLLENKPTFFILEEPESHLYPDAQKSVTEMIGLLVNAGHSALITTHSPYILGEMNNLLLAGQVFAGDSKVVESFSALNLKKLAINCTGAYYLSDGRLQSCVDESLGLIRNEVIDGASVSINEENDRLYEALLQQHGEGGL